MNNTTPLIPEGWLRALVFLIVWLLLQFGLNSIVYVLLNNIFGSTTTEQMSSLERLTITVFSFVTSVSAVWIFRKLVDRKSFLSLGFQWKGFQRHGFTGFFAALFIMCIGSLILMATGNLSFIGIEYNPKELLMYLLIMIIVAVGEEVVIRGYILNNLLESFPKWVALLISALLFAGFHFFNPSFNWLSMLGIFTGGLLLGVNYIYTGNLWFGIFLHFGWNYLQGPILGYAVSGLDIESLLVPSVNGPAWWTGGPFGFEASVLAGILALLTAVYFFIFYQRKQKAMALS